MSDIKVGTVVEVVRESVSGGVVHRYHDTVKRETPKRWYLSGNCYIVRNGNNRVLPAYLDYHTYAVVVSNEPPATGDKPQLAKAGVRRPTQAAIDAAREVLARWGNAIVALVEAEGGIDGSTAEQVREALRTVLAATALTPGEDGRTTT